MSETRTGLVLAIVSETSTGLILTVASNVLYLFGLVVLATMHDATVGSFVATGWANEYSNMANAYVSLAPSVAVLDALAISAPLVEAIRG